MKQDLVNIKSSIDKINSLFIEHCGKLGKSQIQKITSSSHLICLQIRLPGKTYFVYLGRGAEWEGIWLNERGLPAEIRVQDKFLAYVRSSLKSSELKEFISGDDRFIGISYRKGPTEGLFGFFYGQPKLVFVDAIATKDQIGIFCPAISNKPVQITNEGHHDLMSAVSFHLASLGYRKLESVGEVKEQNISDYLGKDIFVAQKTENKQQKFVKRKAANIKNDLEKVGLWRELSSLLMSEEFKLEDYKTNDGYFIYKKIKILIGFDNNVFKAKDRIFEKIKNFKKAEILLEKRLSETLERKTPAPLNRLSNNKEIITPYWLPLDIQIKEKGESQDYILFKVGDVRAAIGKSAKGNDQLRVKWANKEDTWIHIEGHHGPHIILKTSKLMDLNSTQISALAGLLVERNGLDISEVNLIHCPVKQLKGVKGQTGKVLYNKAKFYKSSCLKAWREIIAIDDKA